ncbi:MAG: hypothetical protein NVV66_10095 [Cellulomonas sp.]|uniref:hypothetical protein n=1 Tax=Cellulomonas sp. TaxID=40001 RepID=UPI002583A591|nr:hypothetical protein [Cellulomonas sp.]MCR6705022.1 hypothetical protein [Cellulomonas sp.]MCR6705023.1 hypothetical protein [Cellulomonas sp.]
MKVAAGFHVPAFAVNTRPTVVVPLTVGIGAEVNAAVLMVFAALVRVVVVYPARRPVTDTVIAVPASAGVSV